MLAVSWREIDAGITIERHPGVDLFKAEDRLLDLKDEMVSNQICSKFYLISVR